MFKQIQAAAYIVAAVPSCTIEYARYRKERAARIKQYKEHDAMIEASKARLAETTLVPGYTQIYA